MKSLFSYTLTVVNGDAAGKEWKLFQDVVSLGRHESNHLVFTNPTVSNQQCRILTDNGRLRIENLSKSNQTRLNDVPVGEAELNNGDIIQMGDINVCVSTHENPVTPIEEDAGVLDEEPPTQYMDPAEFSLSDNEPVESPPSNSPSVDDHYIIESKIAQSGQAILYKGRNESSGETVALKLFTHDETDEVSEGRFRRELKILKQLSHKNIVGYRGLFETKGEWGENKRYLVMEFLEGKTLTELIKENPKGMEWDTVRNIFEQILRGLIHALEEHKIIHRDIKPSNIFVLEDGTVKIIDFGISRFDSENDQTGGSGMMGSFDYMAPDFALADDAGFRGDMVSDIFGVFVCLYQTLTGSLPFPKYGDRQELEYLNRWRGSEKKIPSHKHIFFRVVAHLAGFIDQGLAVESSKRFQSFNEVLDALQGLKNRTVVHKKVDSYELLSGLGAGGFGEVYLGKRKSDGIRVAIKKLHSGLGSKRFIKEATILSQYEHPAIVTYLDFFETVGSTGGRSPFLVLEYLEGTALNKQISEHPKGMDTKEVLQLFLCYLSALDFLHNAKASIIHRDIKPGNLHVPLDDPSKAKIFDLGIVKDLSGTQTSGKLPGTYYYMAPEMFTTDNRGTGQTDVYAMGLCLYEALTGSPAYPRLPKNDKDAIVEMIARAQGERQYRVSYNHPAFRDHPNLVRTVQQAINPDPNVRYSDAKHMWEDIASVLELHFALEVSAIGEGMQTAEMSSGGGGRRNDNLKAVRARSAVGKGKRRRKGLLVGLGIILLLLIGVYGVARVQRKNVENYVEDWNDPWPRIVNSILTWPKKEAPVIVDESTGPATVADEVVQLPQLKVVPTPRNAKVRIIDAKGRELTLGGGGYALENDKRYTLEVSKDTFQTHTEKLTADWTGQIERLVELTKILGPGPDDNFEGDMETFRNYNGIKCNSYAVATESLVVITERYEKLIAEKYSNKKDPLIKDGLKDYWAEQLGVIIDGYKRRRDSSLIAVANGAYIHAMQRYSKIMATEDVKAIQEELGIKIAAISFSGDFDQVETYFPVLQENSFTINPNGGTAESVWWAKYAQKQLPNQFRALYLPLRAENTNAGMKMDFALVPFDMMTDTTSVQGKALKQMPINPFYMATAETTGAQMQAFWAAKDPGKELPSGAEPSGPYSDASLEEAIAFCNWLSEADELEPLYERREDGKGWNLDLRRPGYRLPFDSEWEYAARFGFDFFPKSGESDWQAMRDEQDKKVEEQALPKDINSGLVNYYRASLRTPKGGKAYPLGMYDLCGNAPEICMTVKEQSRELKEGVEVEFIQLRGGKFISDIEAVAPWLSDGESNGVHITDEDKDDGEYGFRVIRTVPVYVVE